MGRFGSFALTLAACSALLAGCGGGNADKSANDTYAKGVCTAISNWRNDAKRLSTLPSDGITQVTKDSLDAKLSQFEAATKTFISQIKAVPAPNTSEGKAAKQGIDQLATSARGANTAVQTAVASLPPKPSIMQMATALTTVVPEFRTLKDTTQSTLTALQSGGGPLADAFKSQRACQQLG